MTTKRIRLVAALEGLLLLGALAALVWLLSGCTPIRGFGSLADSDWISSTTARQAAAVAEAEAIALRAIADENDALISRVLGAVTEATSGMETGILGLILGGAATLFVPPPGRRRKEEPTE